LFLLLGGKLLAFLVIGAHVLGPGAYIRCSAPGRTSATTGALNLGGTPTAKALHKTGTGDDDPTLLDEVAA